MSNLYKHPKPRIRNCLQNFPHDLVSAASRDLNYKNQSLIYLIPPTLSFTLLLIILDLEMTEGCGGALSLIRLTKGTKTIDFTEAVMLDELNFCVLDDEKNELSSSS